MFSNMPPGTAQLTVTGSGGNETTDPHWMFNFSNSPLKLNIQCGSVVSFPPLPVTVSWAVPGGILLNTTVSLIPSCCYDRFIACCAVPTTTPTTDLATHSSKWSQEVCNPQVSKRLLCGPKWHRSRVLRLHSRYGTPEKTSSSAAYVNLPVTTFYL